MDKESLMEIMHRWQHLEDEEGWRDILYLCHHEEGEYDPEDGDEYYWVKDLKIWDTYSRTASSPSLGMLIGW